MDYVINSLELIIEYLNTNSGLIVAIATIVLVCVTGWYVRLTQEMLKADNKPEVIVFLHYDGEVISLCVENVGTGYASDIRFEGDLSFKIEPVRGEYTGVLGELTPFKKGIGHLAAGHKIETPLYFKSAIHQFPQRSFCIIVTYKDSTGTGYRGRFPFEISGEGDINQKASLQTDDVAETLKRIANILERRY